MRKNWKDIGISFGSIIREVIRVQEQLDLYYYQTQMW